MRINTLGLATIILWALGYALWLTNFVFEPLPFQLDHSLRGVAIFTLGAMLSFGIGRMLNRLQDRAEVRNLWGVVAATILAATAVLVCFDVVVMHVIAPRWGDPTWTGVLEKIPMLWMFVAWMLLYFALFADAKRRDREVRLAQAITTAIDAQHRLLVQQINPHFLFNALNTVYALVLDGDETRARRCLLALSAFLRRSIDPDAPREVPLSDELASIRHYLEIELTRFGERLHLDESIPPGLLDCRVPALILQPLVENCVKHGLTGHTRRMTIWLSASLEHDTLVLSVEDDGHSPPQGGSWSYGVGLNNVKQRLQLLYGNVAQLTACARPDGGFISRMHLPTA
jgi:two-component system LytT family sensor kinase